MSESKLPRTVEVGVVQFSGLDECSLVIPTEIYRLAHLTILTTSAIWSEASRRGSEDETSGRRPKQPADF